MPTQEQINHAYAELAEQVKNYCSAKLNLIGYQIGYDNRLALGVSTGEIGNKNDHERLAGMLNLFPEVIISLQKAKQLEQKTKADLELAKLQVERLQTLITLLKS